MALDRDRHRASDSSYMLDHAARYKSHVCMYVCMYVEQSEGLVARRVTHGHGEHC